MAKEKRDARAIKISLTKGERAQLEAEADILGLPLAVFIREKALGRKPVPRRSQDAPTAPIIRALINFASNLRQLNERGAFSVFENADEEIPRVIRLFGTDHLIRIANGGYDHAALGKVTGRFIAAGYRLNELAHKVNAGDALTESELDELEQIIAEAEECLRQGLSREKEPAGRV